jgi:hypothetical protein
MNVAPRHLSAGRAGLGANFCRAPTIGDVAPTSMLIRRRASRNLARSNKNGRGEKIRTSDPHNPIVVRYQAALRPDRIVRQDIRLFSDAVS